MGPAPSRLAELIAPRPQASTGPVAEATRSRLSPSGDAVDAAAAVAMGERVDVPDPYYGQQDGFEKVYQMLNKACDSIAQKLLKK